MSVLPAGRIPPVEEGPVVARLVVDGEVVAETSGPLNTFTPEQLGPEGDMAWFSLYFLQPPSDPIDEIQVSIHGEEVGVLTGSGSIPSVEITEPTVGASYSGGDLVVRWEPSGTDQELHYGLYSSTDGESWQSMGSTTDLTGTVPAREIAPDSIGEAQILVTISDGTNGSYTILEPFK